MVDQAEIHRKVYSKCIEDRKEAVGLLGDAFEDLQDKSQAWQDLHRLTQDEDRDVRFSVADALGLAFSYVPNKYLAWQDLHRLTQDQDSGVQGRAADALGLAYSHVPNRDQAWQDLHRLTQDKDKYVRGRAADALGLAYSQVSNRDQAWQDLHKLAQDEDEYVRGRAAYVLGLVFSQVSDRGQAWQNLHRLTQDQDSRVRMYAYHSLGRASVHEAAESEDINALRRYLEDAVGYFEKSADESQYSSPARFCLPFYRSYLSITFQAGSQEAVQKYLTDAREAVGGSESRDELLKAVENLAGALQEAQRTRDIRLTGMQCDLKAYIRFCNQATEHLSQVEKDAPRAAKLIRKGLPIIDQRIRETIGSIQGKAREIYDKGKGTGTVLEATGLELNRWAKELSSEDVLKSERSCSRIEYILQNFCSRIPVDKRSHVCEVVKEIGLEEELPSKLIKIELALSYILNEWQDYDVITKLGEMLDRNKLEIIETLLNAVERNAIPRDLIVETLNSTKDLVSEIKAEQLEIQDPDVAKSLDSWEEAMKSPELDIENMIKVTIPIIPFLLIYEGSYKFQTGMKLDSAWNKLRAIIRR